MAYEFDGGIDGSKDAILFPGVRVSPDQHSYALWFSLAQNLNASSPRQDLLYRDVADISMVFTQQGRPHITLNHDQDGKIGFHARIQQPNGSLDNYDAYDNIKSNTAAWQAGRWYHVAVTWDGNQFRV